MKKLSNYFIVPLILILGFLPAILPDEYRLMIWIIEGILIILALYQHFSGLQNEKRNNEMFDLMNVSIFKNSGNSVFLEKIQKDLQKNGGFTKSIKEELERELSLNPSNIYAIKLHLMGRVYNFMNARSIGYQIKDEKTHLNNLLKDLKTLAEKCDKNDEFINQALGIVFDFLGEYKLAQNHFKKIPSDNLLAGLLLAESLMMELNFQEALEILEIETKKKNKYWAVDFKFAQINIELGFIEKAIPILLEILRSRPYNTEVRNTVAKAYLYSNQYWKSVYHRLKSLQSSFRFLNFKIFLSYLTKFFNILFVAIYFSFGRVLFEIGKRTPYIRNLRNNIYRPDYMIRWKAAKAMEFAQFEIAISHFETACNILPTRSDNLNNIAVCYYFLRDYDNSQRIIQKGIKMNDWYLSTLKHNQKVMIERKTNLNLAMEPINVEQMIMLMNRKSK